MMIRYEIQLSNVTHYLLLFPPDYPYNIIVNNFLLCTSYAEARGDPINGQLYHARVDIVMDYS